MAQKRKTDQTKLIREAALALADKAGWDGLTLKDIAKKAKLPLESVKKLYSGTWDILLHVLKILDEDAVKTTGPLPDESWRDNLFELLMARFELMEAHKAAFTSLPRALARHPKSAARFVRPFHDSMRGLLEQAGAPATPLHVAAFGALYLTISETWKRDDTADLAKTMAVIDKRLALFERMGTAEGCASFPLPAFLKDRL